MGSLKPTDPEGKCWEIFQGFLLDSERHGLSFGRVGNYDLSTLLSITALLSPEPLPFLSTDWLCGPSEGFHENIHRRLRTRDGRCDDWDSTLWIELHDSRVDGAVKVGYRRLALNGHV